MKSDVRRFEKLKRNISYYNRGFISVLCLYIVYAVLYSVSMLDCTGIDYYKETGTVTKDMFTCTNVPSDLIVFFRNNNTIILITLFVIALVLLLLQKIALLKINYIETDILRYEKVGKVKIILLTLLLGYTGVHKYVTENNVVGNIYLINFVIFVMSLIIKVFFVSTYNKYLMFYCSLHFSLWFILVITVFSIIEAFFALITSKDDNGRIFA